MVEEWVSIWKLLSLLFFVVLFFFLFYTLIERVLTKIEFKRNLRLAKDQLFSDIFKNDDVNISEFLNMDDVSTVEVEVRQKLKDLKKDIFCDISKYNLKDLQKRVNTSSVEREKKINKLVLSKYKDAIKSLNNKILYLKTDLDAFKSVASDLVNRSNNTTKETANYMYTESRNNHVRLNSSMTDIEKSLENKIDYIFKDKDAHMHKYIDYIVKNNDKITEEKTKMLITLQEKNESFMKESINNIHKVLKDRDSTMEGKNEFILEQKTKISELEQKMFIQTDFIENKLKQYSLDREYLDNYIDTINKQSNSQLTKNNILIALMVLLFGITITLLILILTKSPVIYSL